jgi:hypothetical protein
VEYLNLRQEFYFIHKLGCGQGGDHRKMFLVLGGCPAKFVKFSI